MKRVIAGFWGWLGDPKCSPPPSLGHGGHHISASSPNTIGSMTNSGHEHSTILKRLMTAPFPGLEYLPVLFQYAYRASQHQLRRLVLSSY